MSKHLTFPIIVSASTFCCNIFASDASISGEAKTELVSILNEGLRDGSITDKQSKDTLKWLKTSPCDGVDRTLANDKKKIFIAALERQFSQNSIEIFSSFKYDGWYILFTSAGHGDEPYLFYSQSPELAKEPLNSWSGAATFFETEEIYQRILKDTPKIPKQLARCFSWHVTLEGRL